MRKSGEKNHQVFVLEIGYRKIYLTLIMLVWSEAHETQRYKKNMKNSLEFYASSDLFQLFRTCRFELLKNVFDRNESSRVKNIREISKTADEKREQIRIQNKLVKKFMQKLSIGKLLLFFLNQNLRKVRSSGDQPAILSACYIIILKQAENQYFLKSNMPQNKKQWRTEELQLLYKLKQAYPSKQWKKISKEFLKKGFHRTQYECREKWVNYLDPKISHEPWTDAQLVTLFAEYDLHSSQWAIIQKALPNRTQIKIKNQFYSLVRNLIRFVLKYHRQVIGRESNTSNRIHPVVLQKIYNGQENFEFLGLEIKKIIREMGYRFDKIKFLRVIKKQEELFKKLNDTLLGYAKKRDEEEIQQQFSLQNIFSAQNQSQNLNLPSVSQLPPNNLQNFQNQQLPQNSALFPNQQNYFTLEYASYPQLSPAPTNLTYFIVPGSMQYPQVQWMPFLGWN